MSSKDIAISVRNLGKAYTIAHNQAKHTTTAEALVHKLRHPFERPDRETFWALKDVSFDIAKGEVVGVIGRNGAGKSTLLKVLSRITEPTKGEAIIRGRVGSLLEVGTGFHAELTGRENIYLNGAILGMSRREIAKQFDAIVDFSGVEQFLDTPVKRYSSGMYVRLAFAVAAHLQPSVLIVDEVLAVGDAEFQKKCLGKMKDVAKSGRTVVFVSHQMQAINSLCTRVAFLTSGKLQYDGAVSKAIDLYLRFQENEPCSGEMNIRRSGTGEMRVTHIACDRSVYLSTDDIAIDMKVRKYGGCLPYFVSVEVINELGVPILHLDSRLVHDEFSSTELRVMRFTIGESRLARGDYQVHAYVCSTGGIMDKFERAAAFSIAPILPYPASRSDCAGHAVVYPRFTIQEDGGPDDTPIDTDVNESILV